MKDYLGINLHVRVSKIISLLPQFDCGLRTLT